MGDLGVSNFDIYMIIYLGKIPVTAWAVLKFFFGFPKGVRLVVAMSTFSLRCLWLSHFLSSFLSAFFHALLLRGISHVSLPKWRVNKTDAVLHRRQEKCPQKKSRDVTPCFRTKKT